MYHISSIDDNEIYFYVVGGGNKKENVYGAWCIEQKVYFFQECWLYYKSTFTSPLNRRNAWNYSKVKCWTYAEECHGMDTWRKDESIDNNLWADETRLPAYSSG